VHVATATNQAARRRGPSTEDIEGGIPRRCDRYLPIV
jgi:hypothetical protein